MKGTTADLRARSLERGIDGFHLISAVLSVMGKKTSRSRTQVVGMIAAAAEAEDVKTAMRATVQILRKSKM